MRRTGRSAALLVAALLILTTMGGSASAQAGTELSQVVCEASGRVFVPGPQPPDSFLGVREDPIAVRGEGICVKTTIPPTDQLLFRLKFTGEGTTTRTGPCGIGIVWRQNILVDLEFRNFQNPLGDVRTSQHVWTTDFSTDLDPPFERFSIPSLYPATVFQMRDPEVKGNLRGLGVYTQEQGFKCPAPNPKVPALFAFTVTGADVQPA